MTRGRFSAPEVLAPKVPLGCPPMPGGPQTVYVPKQELGNEKKGLLILQEARLFRFFFVGVS
jgi:hypothetical protein